MDRSYADLVYRRQREYGERFSEADLDKRFISFFESGERIRVFDLDQEITGTVDVTTGWKPAFLLMRRSSDMGSGILLGPKTKILAVQRNGRYVRYIG